MAEDNFGQDELVEILATSTAVAAPARKSFKDVMYMKDFAPDMTNYVPEVPEIRTEKGQYLKNDYKKLIESIDKFLKDINVNPKELDKLIVSEVFRDSGNNTHPDIVKDLDTDLQYRFAGLDNVKKEKAVGEFLSSLIEIEQDIQGKSLSSLAATGVDTTQFGMSLFTEDAVDFAHSIDQDLETLHSYKFKDRLKKPMDVVEELKAGTWNKLSGANELINGIGLSLVNYVSQLKLETTRTFVPETQRMATVLFFLRNKPDVIKNAELAAQQFPEQIKLDFTSFDDFVKTRVPSFLERTDVFYERLVNPDIFDRDWNFFGNMDSGIKQLYTVLPDVFPNYNVYDPDFIKYVSKVPGIPGGPGLLPEKQRDFNKDIGLETYKGPHKFIDDIEIEKLTVTDLPEAPKPDVRFTFKDAQVGTSTGGRWHMATAHNLLKLSDDLGVDLYKFDNKKMSLVPANQMNLFSYFFQPDVEPGVLEFYIPDENGIVDNKYTPDKEKILEFENKVIRTPLDDNFILKIDEPPTQSKQTQLDNIRSTFVDNHGEDALKKAEDIVKNKPKFASKVLKGLSKLDVGQEVIEKALTKVGTKYGMASVTGPAAGLLAFYETMVLAADVTNAATKAAFDKDVDFWDNFGKIDDKYSITYKLTKPFYETLFKGIGGITKPTTENNQVQSYYGK